MRVAPTTSRWRREDFRNRSWIGLDVDEDKEGRKFVDIQTSFPYQIRGRRLEGYLNTGGRNIQQTSKGMESRLRCGAGSYELKGVGPKMEEMPIEFIDRKKRQ